MQGEGRRVASLRATGARAEPLPRSPAYASPPCGLWMPASLTSLHPSTRWTERNTHAHTHTPYCFCLSDKHRRPLSGGAGTRGGARPSASVGPTSPRGMAAPDLQRHQAAQGREAQADSCVT